MKTVFVKFVAIAVTCAGLAIFWHALKMEMSMSNDDGMSAACLTVCLGETAQTSPAIALAVQMAAVVVLFVLLIVIFFGPFSWTVFGLPKKDRHRYLMKTMVMRR